MSGLYINSGEWGGNTGLDTLSGLYTPSGLWNVGGTSAAFGFNFLTSSSLPQGATFSRGTTATYYNQSGLLTSAAVNGPRFDYDPGNVLQQNLLLQSQTFETGWSLSALAFLTPNVTVAPDGTFTADLMVPNATVIDHRVTQTVSVNAGVTYTASICSKAAGYPYIEFVPFTTPSNTVASFTTTSIDVGNGWLLRTCTFTVPTGDTAVQIRVVVSNGATQAFAGDGTSGVYIWGAQLNRGSTALPYLATTSTTQAVCAPRGLLIEEARTNATFPSQTISGWTLNGTASVADNTLVSPDGATDASQITATAGGSGYWKSTTVTTATVYTGSLYLKAISGSSTILVGTDQGVAVAAILTFNMLTGAITSPSASVTSSGATYVGNGWWRVWWTFTTNSTLSNILAYGSAGQVYGMYGAQLEAGAFATSYIPTTSATVTRNADVCSWPSMPSWFNGNSGTAIFTADTISPTAYINRGLLGTTGSPTGYVSFISASGAGAIYDTSATVSSVNLISTNTVFTAGSSYSDVGTTMSACLSGGSVSTGSHATSFSTSTSLTLGQSNGSAYLNGHIQSFAYYNYAMSSSALKLATSTTYVPTLSYNFLSGTLPSGLTFSRGSAATYYNQSGLLAYAPENLLPNSEQIDLWTKVGSTVTANAAVAPDGTTSADKIVADATTGSHSVRQVLSLGAGTFSAYLKAGEYTWAVLGTGVANEAVWFDLANGVIGTAQSAASGYVITSVGNGWFRCSIYSVGATNLQILLSTGNGVLTFPGYTANGIYAWGAQFNPGSTATAYVPTTTAAVYGPRFDYDPSSFVAQNLLTYSSTFDNAIWVKSLATVTANSVVAPDGTLTADEIAFSSTSGYLFQEYAITTVGTVLTFSAWLRAASATTVNFLIQQNGGTSTSITASLTTEWQRFSVSFTTNVSAGAPTFVRAQLVPNANTPTLYAWGAQLNVGSTVLPYLATTSTTQAVCVPRGLLIEEARTNLLLQSNDFQTSWTPTNITRTLNSTLSPEGVVNGVKIEATAAAGTSLFQTAVVAATSATGSVYVKQGTSATIANGFLIRNATTATILLAGTLNYSTGVFTYTTGVSGATATNVGNGWWRLQLSVTTGITSGDSISFYTGWNGISATAGDFLYAYGAQLEAGAFATSYIPTTSATVTRNLDALSTPVGSWFNPAAGTIFVQATPDEAPATDTIVRVAAVFYDVVSFQNAIRLERLLGGWRTVVTVAGTSNLASGSWATGATGKLGATYISGGSGASFNGATVSSIAGNIPTGIVTLVIGSNGVNANAWCGHIQSFSYYNYSISVSSLPQLTS